MSENKKFRVRLRVRIGMSLNTDEPMIVAHVCEREVQIKSQIKNQPLREAKWIVFTTGGFDTAEEAQAFGNMLQTIAGIVGFRTGVGIDVGEGQSISFLNEDWARSVGLIRAEERIEPTVHGIIVSLDDGLSRFHLFNAVGSCLYDPASFLSSVTELGENLPVPMAAASAGIRLLNLALLSAEPLAQVVLAVSAIEALGQDQNWTAGQKARLQRLAIDVETGEDAGIEEKEIADALRRNLHRIGLRQGVRRVFSRLGLDHLNTEWDSLYDVRSNVFHGTKHLTEAQTHQLAQAAIKLCGQVVDALLHQEEIGVSTINSAK